MEVADDFYDENAFGYDAPHGTGILFLIDMDNRQAWISTSGEAITYFTDQRIEWTLDNIFEFLPDGNYAGSFQAFLDSVELYMNRPVRAGETSDGSVWWAGNLFQAGVGLVVGLIVVFTFIARSRSRMTAGNRDYMTGVRMNVADDQFLRKAGNRTPDPEEHRRLRRRQLHAHERWRFFSRRRRPGILEYLTDQDRMFFNRVTAYRGRSVSPSREEYLLSELRTAYSGLNRSRYIFRLFACRLIPAFTSRGITFEPFDIRKSISAVP